MGRGRKPKMSETQIDYMIMMKGFVLSLDEMVALLEKACGIEVTIPTVRTHFINQIGKKEYDALILTWRRNRVYGES